MAIRVIDIDSFRSELTGYRNAVSGVIQLASGLRLVNPLILDRFTSQIDGLIASLMRLQHRINALGDPLMGREVARLQQTLSGVRASIGEGLPAYLDLPPPYSVAEEAEGASAALPQQGEADGDAPSTAADLSPSSG